MQKMKINHIMRKPSFMFTYIYAEIKDADQPTHARSMISIFLSINGGAIHPISIYSMYNLSDIFHIHHKWCKFFLSDLVRNSED